jgi:nitrogen fixation protein NifB
MTTNDLPDHPCMNHDAHRRVARLHLPVAPRCTAGCGYCERKIADTGNGSPHINRPGYSRTVLSPDRAADEAEAFVSEWGSASIIGIAGPGDPLANVETFETFARIRRRLPESRLCLCTNGLNLPESIDRLKSVDLGFLSVTVNAVDPAILESIYSHVVIDNRMITGRDAATRILESQLDGIAEAVRAGMAVKVNTVVIPGVNDHHVTDIARAVSNLGARVMNLMPLIPGGRFGQVVPPDPAMMKTLFDRCEHHIRVFRLCRQCRADARGIPGKDPQPWKKTA